MSMKPEYKEAWLKALESGEYQQCKGWLYDGIGYCCLGVLLKSAGAVITKSREFTNGHDFEIGGRRMSCSSSLLNEDALELFGLTDEEQTKLARANDGHHLDFPTIVEPKTFAEIAQIIREEL